MTTTEPAAVRTDAAQSDQQGTPAPAGGGQQGGQEAHKEGQWWTLVAVCLGTFMLLLDVTIVNVALPDIQGDLKASFSDLQWVIDAYALTLAALLLTTGSLADLYGRRRLYLIGLGLFIAASLLCGIAQGPLQLEISRGLQGIGGAVMFSVSLALLANAFRGKQRGTAFAIWGGVTGIAVAIGPVLGGALTSGLSWRWIFFVNLPIGLVAAGIVAAKVVESRQQGARRPDWVGFVVFSAALAFLVYGLIEAGRKSWTDTLVLACFAAAIVLLAIFIAVELRSQHAMLDLSLFRLPTFTGGAIAAFGVSAGIFAMLLYLVLYLQNVLGFSALQTGLRLLVLSAGILVVSGISGRLTSTVPIRFLIGPGLLLVGIALLLMRGLTATSSWTHLVPGLIVAGVGVGLINPPLASTAVGVVQPQRAGMASGVNSTFRQVGIATGIALLGTLFATRLRSEVTSALAGSPLSGRSEQISGALQGGQLKQVLGGLPPQQQGLVAGAARQAFTSGLDHILLVAAVGTFAAALGALALIRQQDLVQHGGPAASGR